VRAVESLGEGQGFLGASRQIAGVPPSRATEHDDPKTLAGERPARDPWNGPRPVHQAHNRGDPRRPGVSWISVTDNASEEILKPSLSLRSQPPVKKHSEPTVWWRCQLVPEHTFGRKFRPPPAPEPLDFPSRSASLAYSGYPFSSPGFAPACHLFCSPNLTTFIII
jgi:hypothetical protein